MTLVPRSDRAPSLSVRVAGGFLAVALIAACGSDGGSDSTEKVDKTRELERIAAKPNRTWRIVINRRGNRISAVFN